MSKLHIKALEQARMMIENDTEYFICVALTIANCYTERAIAADQIREWIDAALKGISCFTTYSDWLRDNHPKFYKKHVRNNPNRCKQGRLQWIDWMIDNHTIFDNI